MSNLVVIFICLIVGLLLQKKRDLSDAFAASLNTYVIYVALPALVLYEIHRLELNAAAVLPIVFAWVLMLITALTVFVVAKKMCWSRGVTGALMLTLPLGNTGFVGIPLLEALLGREAIPYAILYDQFGTFLALNTFGSFFAAYYSGGVTQGKQLFVTIVKFPPLIALLLAFVTLSLPFPEWFSSALARISSTLVPVVMVAVGVQWRLKLDRETLIPLCFGLFIALIFTPAVAYCLLVVTGIHGLVAQSIVLEAAMPAMISAGVLAMNYQLAPRLAASLVGYSLLFSLLTVWLWRQIL